MNPLIEAFALKIMEDPQTYVEARASGRLPWDAVREAVGSVDNYLNKPVTHAAWNMPALTSTLVNWANEDPAGYDAFLVRIVPDDTRQRTLGTLPGFWRLYTILNGLADDHDYVLQSNAEHFRLAREGEVVPWQGLVGPTELAQSILKHRGLPPLVIPDEPSAPHRPHGRRARAN